MKTRNVILSGMIALVLAMSAMPVFAGEIDIGGGPNQEHPQVYLLKKVFDICDQYGGEKSGSEPLPGGSVPPSGQQFGCVDYIGDRFNEYLFTGEQMATLVAVRHTQGASLVTRADLALDGAMVAKCSEITPESLETCVGTATRCKNLDDQTSCEAQDGCSYGDGKCTGTATACEDMCLWKCADQVGCEVKEMWYGHDVSTDLAEQPPGKTAATSDGFDPDFDKLYQCILTAQEDMIGEYSLTVIAEDQYMNQGESVPDSVWFNPGIFMDVFLSSGTAIEFTDGSAGQTVYSTNTLKIKNEDPDSAGVDVAVWLAGTDLTSSVLPAQCPDTNVLEAENIDFRCKIGTVMNNPWHKLPNPNDKEPCTIVIDQDNKPLNFDSDTWPSVSWVPNTDNYVGSGTCQGALDIVPDARIENILHSGHTAECWFRLTYPVPCAGFFDMGQVLLFARAI